MNPRATDPVAIRARRAISFVFLLNGMSFCAILPRYPEIVERLGISNTEFGLAVALGPLGGLVVGVFAAAIMAKLGSGRAALIFQVIASTSHLLIYVAPSWGILALGFLLAMAADSITDAAQNTHGMRVERLFRRSIMNSYHGFWSLGAVLGGLVGAAAAQLAVPLLVQGVAALVLFAVAAAATSPFLLKGPDTSEKDAARAELAGPSAASAQNVPFVGTEADAEPPHQEPSSRAHTPAPGGSRLRLWGLLVALGMILVFAGSTEDAGSTWGALFMSSTFGAIPFVAGLAFVALQGTQMVARFLGDRIVDAWGDRKAARVGAAISVAGMSLAMLVPSEATAIVGFAAAGWGVATLFPAVFRTSDHLEGLRPGGGITVVSWFARLGFLLAPPLVGWLGDLVTLRYALWLIPIYALGIFVFSGALETKEGAAERGGASA